MTPPNKVTRPNSTKRERRKMYLTQAVSDYGEAIRDTKLAHKTQHQYASRARDLCRWLTKRLQRDPLCADVTSAHIRAFLDDKMKHVSPASAAHYHTQLSYLCGWLYAQGYALTVATEKVQRPEVVAKRRPLPPAEVIAAIMKAPDRLYHEDRRRLARCVLALLFQCGLRPGEVRNLRLKDYDKSARILHITYSKGNKSRECYPPREVCLHIDAYLKVRPEGCKHDYLLAFDRGRRLGEYAMRRLFREILTAADLRNETRLTPHIGRHVLTSALFEVGADLNTIKDILGHASLRTTEIYAHSTPEGLRAAMEKVAQRDAKTAPATQAAKREEQKRFRRMRLR